MDCTCQKCFHKVDQLFYHKVDSTSKKCHLQRFCYHKVDCTCQNWHPTVLLSQGQYLSEMTPNCFAITRTVPVKTATFSCFANARRTVPVKSDTQSCSSSTRNSHNVLESSSRETYVNCNGRNPGSQNT